MALDVFDLWAKIGFDSSEYDRGLDEAEKKANGFGDKLGSAFGVAAKAIAAATAAAATGAAALVKQSVDAYANQEQLIGGIETLFSNLEGTVSAAPIVLENAANAYKTAGMSANQYMETVTSFSAALIAGLEGDYQKAAEVSDMAISDMADNANKLGTSLSSIQLAYQGFSRQQYQLLDNLKLGYGGTKTEMERLLADAEKISGIKYDISNLSDVYNAIHVIQQEMGITGTTAKEANDTISGSMGQLSGAWANLVAGFADSQADIPALIDNVVETAEVSFGNLLPVVEQAIGGVAEFVEDIAPIVVEKLPDVVDQVVPPLLNAADTIVGALVETLPTLLGAVVDVVPGLVTNLSQKIIDISPSIAKIGVTFITSFSKGIAENAPILISSAVDAVYEIADTLTDPTTLSSVVNAGLDIVVALAEGIGDNIPKLADTVMTIAGNIYEYVTSPEFIPKVLDAGVQIIASLAGGILSAVPTVIESVVDVLDRMVGRATDAEYEEKWSNAGTAMVDSMSKSFESASENFLKSVENTLQRIDNILGTNIAGWYKKFEGFSAKLGNWAWETNMKLYGGNDALQKQADSVRAVELNQKIRYSFNEKYRSGMDVATAYRQASLSAAETQDDYRIIEQYLNDITVETAETWAKMIDDSDRQAKAYASIPTEALRQMHGEAAPILTELPKITEESAEGTENALSGLTAAAEETGTAVKEALTFDTKAIGDYRNLGVVEVLGKALSEEDEKAKKIADTVFSASQEYVERQTNTLDLSLQKQIEMWESVQAQFVEGSEQYLKAGDKIVALQKRQATELANEAKKTADEQKRAYDDRVKAIEDYQKQVDKIYSEIEDIEQKYTDTLAERTSDIYDSFGLFEKVPDRVLYSGQDLIANVQGQVATLQKWVDDLAKLEARGVDAETMAELRAMGVGATDQIDALLDLTDSELDTWVAAVGEKRKLAADTATSELADVAQETADKVNEKLGEAADLTKDTAKNLGMSISEMIAEGITDGAAVIATAAQSALSFAGIDMSSLAAEPTKTIAPSTNKLTDAVRSAFGIGTSIFGINNASETAGETTVSSSPQTTTANNSGESAQTTKITQKITVNINGVQYQNLNDLTQAISEELERLMTREVGYGAA